MAGGLFVPMMVIVRMVALFTLSAVQFSVPSMYLVMYLFFALLLVSYPVSGFLADVYCGRFRVVTVSLFLTLCLMLVFCVTCALIIYEGSAFELASGWIYFIVAWSMLCVCGVIIGGAGYYANVIQFGLDQLLDAPSHHQALFVHWEVWSYDLPSVVFAVVFAVYSSLCYLVEYFVALFVSLFLCCSCALCFLLIFGCFKRQWFYSQPVRINPFKIIVKVLNFARKHKYPLQRSAFTYCDDERPSRLDFCKQRFGGPFTTEQVEDVKTFLRILVVLLTIGSISVMDVLFANVSFMFISEHITSSIVWPNCSQWKIIVSGSGLIKSATQVVFLPVYIWVVFVILKRKVPRILFRLWLGIVIYLLAVLSVLALDVTGHSFHHGNDTRCMFNLLPINNSSSHVFSVLDPRDNSLPIYVLPDLNMHWSLLIPSSILLGIGPTIMTASTFEFISAQSPHNMKGLLLGMYFAITGVFQFVGSAALAPFSSPTLRDLGISCLTLYCIITGSIALTGLVLFTVVAKRYKYREREDRPYDQRFVIDVYNRYLNHV